MFGTELDSAYAPFNSDNAVVSPFLQDVSNTSLNFSQGNQRSSSEIVHKSTPIANLSQGPVTQTQPNYNSPIQSSSAVEQIMAQQQQQQQQQQPQQSYVPANSQEAKIALLVNELKKQQKLTANIQQQSTYLDKLFAKKKELLKIIQFSLIIVLAMSIHFIIDYYLKYYIKNNDLTFERELIIRLIYPISIIFILWNLKTFLK
jgi:hypothetical protein